MDASVRLYVKRDDRYSPLPGTALQGNKVRKLAPLLPDLPNYARLVSFGGPYSNHLAALFALTEQRGLSLTCFVRGEVVSNPILDAGAAAGGEVRFLDRTTYRRKHLPEILYPLLQQVADDHQLSLTDLLVIPEGGTFAWDSLNVPNLNHGKTAAYHRAQLSSSGQPLHEIAQELGRPPDYCCVSMGTGGTAAGLALAARTYPTTRLEVFPALRGHWMRSEIERIAQTSDLPNLRVHTTYHTGGYAKFPSDWTLHRPPGQFAYRVQLPGRPNLPPLEPVYTAKLFRAVLTRLQQDHYPPGSTVALLHTGGIY